ncbi:hypothetical protein FZI88_15910, partial [Mycobacterium sp. CBMA295]|nr:hypothetical protein [Mycolicibacterium sp. CBMA 295]
MAGPAPLRILVYSDNPRTREQVRLALGKRVHPELPELDYVEIATAPMVKRVHPELPELDYVEIATAPMV